MLARRLLLLMLVVSAYIVSSDPVTGPTCAFNLCQTAADIVCPGATCTLTEVCDVKCVCDENSTSSDCLNVTTAETFTTVTGNGRTGCSCINGHCSNDNDTCVCDSGWDGEKCDLPCSSSCPVGQRCTIIHVLPGFPTMEFCKNISTVKETTTIQLNPTTEHSFNRTYNVCDPAYTLRPRSESVCNEFTCIYGICGTNGKETWCECDLGSSGQICQHNCCRECVYGSCFYDTIEEKEICNCNTNYSGPYCEGWDPPTTYAPPKEVTWHLWVVGACVIVLLILLTLMVVVPYILWRNRVILVMKVVHYFQGYEDDDDRQWDAFISYKSTKSDETFVVKTLFPKLEKELGFNVNVHYRDFVPGETIANNIITAVQSSRRTIMIITPSYVTSEFTKFEYQVAQQEMLKRKHRIIPILLDDITECKDTIDPNLKVILDSVTYIQWPQDGNEKKLDKFWKRLELSMPKIKNRTIDSNNAKVSSIYNGSVSMTKPGDVSLSFSKDKNKPKSELSNGNTNICSIIDERKLEPEEFYDTLNESEMQSKMIKRKTEFGGNPKQDKNLNVLKVNL